MFDRTQSYLKSYPSGQLAVLISAAQADMLCVAFLEDKHVKTHVSAADDRRPVVTDNTIICHIISIV